MPGWQRGALELHAERASIVWPGCKRRVQCPPHLRRRACCPQTASLACQNSTPATPACDAYALCVRRSAGRRPRSCRLALDPQPSTPTLSMLCLCHALPQVVDYVRTATAKNIWYYR